IAEEITCYSLPYGALGFVSHVLTYYTIGCLWAGRSPLWPRRKVKYTRVDLAIGIVGLCISTGLAIHTLVKCRDTWQLLVIAVWKLSMSLLNGITAVQVAITIFMDNESHGKAKRAAWWILLCECPPRVCDWMGLLIWENIDVPGMFAGMIGLMSLVVHNHSHKGVIKLTGVFYSLVGVGVVVSLLAFCCQRSSDQTPRENDQAVGWGLAGLYFSVALFVLLAAFYSDWALGMMTGNIVGLPSGDTSGLFWTYFLAKRLTMLSW
ncbi:hypothetical protein BD779DRAFT_1436605, partial [Infundibulicybe gibba]